MYEQFPLVYILPIYKHKLELQSMYHYSSTRVHGDPPHPITRNVHRE